MRIVLVALLAGLAVSCSGAEGGKEALGDPTSHQTVECREAVDVVEDPGPSYTVHGAGHGFVALPSREMQLGRWGPEGSEYAGHRFSKFGLPVRRFRQVTLEVVGAPGEAVLDYGGGSVFAPVDALTVGPCDTEGDECVIEPTENLSVGPCGSDRGEWVVWAGGMWVNEPGCVELVARSDDEEISVWLAVGAPCHRATAGS